MFTDPKNAQSVLNFQHFFLLDNYKFQCYNAKHKRNDMEY